MDTLILTGWGWKEYAVAAAAALRALDGRADVLGMSKRRLPEFIESEGANWKRICLIGLSLAGDEARLAAAVATSCDPPEVAGRAILAADTIVWFDNRIYGKPRDLEEAKEFLRELSGQTHVVFTGVAFRAEDGTERTVCVESHVTFRALSEEMIEVYVARVHPTDRAGAYDIDESGDLIVASYTGSYENIMGLPVEPLRGFGILESAPSTTH